VGIKLRQLSFVHPQTFSGGVAQQSVKKFRGVRDYLWSFGYHSNLNPLSVLDDESPTTESRRKKGGFIRPLEPVQGEFHQGLLDWHLRRNWDVDVDLDFGDRFHVGKVTVRDLFV
jgi:hypothetical protein